MFYSFIVRYLYMFIKIKEKAFFLFLQMHRKYMFRMEDILSCVKLCHDFVMFRLP